MRTTRPDVWFILLIAVLCGLSPAQESTWPPPLPPEAGAVHGVVTLTTDEFLQPPAELANLTDRPDWAPFVIARVPPTVEFVMHGDLPDAALNGTGWSAWGDICVASDGSVYVGIGDHGKDVAGLGRVFIYRWDPVAKTLTKIIDPNAVAGIGPGQTSFSKIHAAILEGSDGGIYFTATLNSGARAGQVAWTDRVPGGLIYRHDPRPGKQTTEVIGHMTAMCTATTLLDRARNILYVCLEGQSTPPAMAALGAFDLETRQWVFTSAFDAIHFDRNLALDHEGNVYFNHEAGKLWRYSPETHEISDTGLAFPAQLYRDRSGLSQCHPSMRSSTRQAEDGYIYGSTMRPGRLFRFHPRKQTLEILGPDFLDGGYTTVTVLSPDEKYLYYLPGAHGSAKDIGTPVVQYEIATGQRKVLAFLRGALEKRAGVVVSGTYGVKLSADGSTLYANLNGHAGDGRRLEKMRPNGFGLTSFVAVHIPEQERN